MDVSSFELDLIFLVLQKVDRFHLCLVFNLHARSFYSRCFSRWGPWSSRSASPENVLAIQIVRPDPGSTKSESEAEIYPALCGLTSSPGYSHACSILRPLVHINPNILAGVCIWKSKAAYLQGPRFQAFRWDEDFAKVSST